MIGGENYVEGDLGAVFNQAQPITLPVAVQLLRGRRDAGDEIGSESPAVALIERTCEQVEMMQETCADEQSVQRVMRMKLRLREDNETGFTNAHLANLVLDSEGNVTGVRDTAEAENEAHAVLKTERMKAFEVVALATLRPKTIEEAVILIPSLSRYDTSDLSLVLGSLDSF